MAEHNLSRIEDELREGPEYKGPYLSRIEKLLKDYDPGGSSYDGPYDSIEDLPETGDPKKIYLVVNGDTDDYYDEYYWDEEHSKYQPMGTTKLDLAAKADNDKVVHNTGNETILGEKTFHKIKLEDDDQYGVPAQFILPSGEEAIFVNPIDNTEGTNLDLDDYTDSGIYKFMYVEQGVHNPDNIPENLETILGIKFYMFLEVQGRMQDSSDDLVVLQNLYAIGTDLSENDRNNGRVLVFSRIRSLVDNSYEWSDWKRCDVDQAIIEGDTKYLKLDGSNKMTGMLEAPSAKLSTDNNNALMIMASGALGGLLFGQTTDDDTTKAVFFTVNRKNADISIGANITPSSTQNGMVMHIRNQGNPNDSSIDFNFSTEFKKNLNVLGNLTVNGHPINLPNVIFTSVLPEASADTMDKIYITQPIDKTSPNPKIYVTVHVGDAYSWYEMAHSTSENGVFVGETVPTALLGEDGDYYYRRTDKFQSGGIASASSLTTSGTYYSGYKFTVTANVDVIGLRTKVVSASQSSPYVTITLSDENGIIAQAENVDVYNVDEDGWGVGLLDTPVTLIAGNVYYVEVQRLTGQLLYGPNSRVSQSEYVLIDCGVYRSNFDTPASQRSLDRNNVYIADIVYKKTLDYYYVYEQYKKSNGTWVKL